MKRPGRYNEMSYLSTLRKSINDKLGKLEEELGPNTQPHLFNAKPWPYLDGTEDLPPQPMFDLLESLRLDLRALDAIITPSRFKLVEVGNLPYKVAALETAVLLNVAEAIESPPFNGMAPLIDLAKQLDVNTHKLGRILRLLTGDFIFQEVSPGTFKNTRHSSALRAPGARSFLSFISDLGMRSAGGICKDIMSPETRHSFAERDAPFCKVVSKDGKTFAEYMGDPENAAMVELSGEGVVGWLNKLTRASLLNDYPWAELPNGSRIIDLGAGAGDSGLDVMKMYGSKKFRWIYQDFEPILGMLKNSYPAELQQQVQQGDISFVVQDYFKPNTSEGEVWYARGVLHEYDDKQVLDLLDHITTGMRKTPSARLIINEVLNSSPTIVPAEETQGMAIGPPSEYVPERQSALASTANTMTWSTFSLFGGKERSYEEYEELLNRAGLEVVKLWKFRTFTVMIECVLREEENAC